MGIIVQMFGIYNPSNTNLDILDVTTKTIILEDFNAHVQEWGYQDKNQVRHTIIEFLMSKIVELLYKYDTPTYLHYNGSTTNPDVNLVSSDIFTNCGR